MQRHRPSRHQHPTRRPGRAGHAAGATPRESEAIGMRLQRISVRHSHEEGAQSRRDGARREGRDVDTGEAAGVERHR